MTDEQLVEVLSAWRKSLEAELDGVLIEDGQCRHEFQEYIGFSESYHYCIKCDTKQSGITRDSN